ncbi:SAM-dependent methyltransferase [Candidatus Woesearchaeota archaeon]|jgi:SAM-dependent methyltransferase|nr:SAM-dependent methyltransferase [Candidatus Woesearchaeota archaeon]|tara:strand:- start:1951 stop:3171 length:1221 start_codon:yes stop_codon:yes gene_type:complete
MICRICRNEAIKVFLSLGKSPLANSFLSKEELENKENTYPLELAFCDNCKLVQLTYVVPPELMFKNYIYVSSTSNTFKIHFSKMARDICNCFNLNNGSLVVDIGSNDGLLLKNFQKLGIQTMGIEPAANLVKIAEQDGIETINGFFNNDAVKRVIGKKGHADVVTANNVFAHIDDIDNVTDNVKTLLKEDGIFVIEVQYLVDTMEKMTFDNVYHEHLSYYTLTSLSYFFKKHRMEIFDVQRVDSHGGSLRVFIKKSEGNHEIHKEVEETLEYEKGIGINDIEIYKNFSNKVYHVKERLVSYIRDIKAQKKSIAGYGAPAKSTTLLNFCNIGRDFIDYIVDDNPLKIGLYSPGTHIPVVSSSMLEKKRPDYILILAWNFAEEILKKTGKYADQGVKFIIPLPEPKIA